jgi:5-formyltetrahydrofolate cyclo-ligase
MTGKQELRQALRERRRALLADPEWNAARRALEHDIGRRIIAHLNDAIVVAGYCAEGTELDALPALRAAHGRGCVTALPHIAERGSPMRFLRWEPGQQLIAGVYGLLQPPADAPEVDPDLILAPLLGFDRAMRRLGQGAGFYDRAFARLPAARRIGLAWSVQEVDELPADPWDVPLHAVVTEKEWIEPKA